MTEETAPYTTNNQAQTNWVILEAMGHICVAGRYYFENGLHRVDIPNPADPDQFIRTERFGPGAIFRITNVSREVAIAVAARYQIPDAIPWDLRRQLNQLAAGETIEAFDVNDFIEEQIGDDGDPPGW